MPNRALRVISNFERLHRDLVPEVPITHEYIGDRPGWRGTLHFLRKCLGADLLILNIATRELLLICLLRWLFPLGRLEIVSVDVVLRPPRTTKQRIAAFVKRVLLSRVHLFILYFKDLGGYQRFYGIGPQRALYVPFKINSWEKLSQWPDPRPDGEFVLCAGRTLRDVESFIAAMRQTGLPGLLLQQPRELLTAHGTQPWTGELPENLELVIDESPGSDVYYEYLSRARLIVIPRFRHDIAATGISTYLTAMALNKCVIISAGPGADDLLTDQAVIVPPEQPARLADEIARLWQDDALRSGFAARGRAYALSLENEERLLTDILRASIRSLGV